MIDSWLAGELSGDEARWVEDYFEANPPEQDIIDREMLRGLAARRGDPGGIEDLVERVRTRDGVRRSGQSEWRDILVPSEGPGVLGTLGHYEVLDIIAEGGMGIVLKARDPKLGRFAAVKVLSPDLATNRTARERFLREARAAALLEHENVLPIYGIHGEPVPWFAMRYVAGGSLQDALDQGEPIRPDRLKVIALGVASALDAAHAAGIIHRDIKPGNILLEEEGDHVWVCDFGIARCTEDPALTYAGTVAGTPQYMSPEQAEGRPLDGRSDLFSLGAVLYRGATGKPVFEGATTPAVLRSVAEGASPDSAQLRRHLPRWFAGVVACLLEKEPGNRFRDAGALIRAVTEERAPRRGGRVRRRVFLGVALVLPVLLLLGLLLRVPLILEPANRLLGSRFDQAYFIEGKLGAYGGLAEAVMASRDGDTLMVPSDSAITVDGFAFPEGRALTLRPDGGTGRARVSTGIVGAPGLIARSPLRLVGLDFELGEIATGEPLILMEGARLVLDDCRFTGGEGTDLRSEDITTPAVELRGAASIEIIGCDFDLRAGNLLRLSDSGQEPGGDPSPMEVMVRDTSVSARRAIVTEGGKIRVARPLSVEMSGSEIRCETVLAVRDQGDFPLMRVEASDCVFIVGKAFAWHRSPVPQSLIGRFSWAGSGNAFPAGNDVLWTGASARFGEAAALHPLEAFAEGVEGTEQAAAGQGRIEDAATGRTYADFERACEEAPDGSTLLLSGFILCRKEVIAPLGKALHLRPAPGASPVVIGADALGHALFLQGPATIEGIRFVRHDTIQDALPILGVKPNGGDVEVRDCVFEAIPLQRRRKEEEGFSPGIGYGLSLTDFGSAIIQRCVFRTPGGTALYLGFVNEITVPAHLVVTDSILLGARAIDRVGRRPDTHATVDLERCSVLSDFFYSDLSPQVRPSIEFSVRDCILDVRRGLLTFIGREFADVRADVGWSGEDNAYREGMSAVLSPPQESGAGGEPVPGLDFEALRAALPRFAESGSTFGAPFDRMRLREPLTAADLADTTGDSGETVAVQALRMLARRQAAAGSR